MDHSPVSRVKRPREAARASYNRLSRWYDLLAGGTEKKYRDRGLGMLDPQPGEKILEIGLQSRRADQRRQRRWRSAQVQRQPWRNGVFPGAHAILYRVTDNNSHRLAKASAILLTGGKSSRMGQPKCLLPFDGEPLIFHVWRTLSLLFAEIIIVAAPGQELPSLKATLIRDDVAYQGPVGGIYYGLRAATGEFAFATACDVPFLNPELIAYLASIAADNDAVVPCWRNRLQPLHAFYHRSIILK